MATCMELPPTWSQRRKRDCAKTAVQNYGARQDWSWLIQPRQLLMQQVLWSITWVQAPHGLFEYDDGGLASNAPGPSSLRQLRPRGGVGCSRPASGSPRRVLGPN